MLVTIMLLLLVVIFAMALFLVHQINLAGMDVRSFYDFVNAHSKIDKMYFFAKKYQKMSRHDRDLFLEEAKKIFDAYDNVPTEMWEENYEKYMLLLDRYHKLKIDAWKDRAMTDEEFIHLVEEVNGKTRKARIYR